MSDAVAEKRQGCCSRKCLSDLIPEARRFYMLDIYGKDEKDDLSNDDKQCLAELIDKFRAQAIASVNRAIAAGKDGKTS